MGNELGVYLRQAASSKQVFHAVIGLEYTPSLAQISQVGPTRF